MKEIQSIEEFNEVSQGDGVVFMFTAGWCPDCVVIEPDLPEIEATHSDLEFYKINRDHFIDLCQELDILGIPSFLFYKKGHELHRFVSKHRKTKEEINQFLLEAKGK